MRDLRGDTPESGHVRCKKACPLYPRQRPRKRISAQGHVRFTALQLEHECSQDYHSPQSGHGLSDRDGSHVRIDSRVDLVRAVCGRADPFGNRNGSAMRRRMS